MGQFFSAPFIGILSDRHGRKPVLQVTYLFICLGYLISALGIWKHDLFFLILGRVVTGVGAGNISVINSAVSDISPKSDKTKNFALITMANGFGFAVGPFLGGTLSYFGFSAPFIAAGLLSLGGFFMFYFIFQETYVPQKEPEQRTSSVKNLFRLACFGKFRILFPAFFIFCIGWSFYWDFIPVTWIKEYRLKVPQIGNFYAYGSAFYVLSSGFLIRPFIKKFNGISILAGALGILGISLLLLFHCDIRWYWLGISIQQFMVALVFPIGTAIVSNEVSGSQQGEVLGAFQALQSLAFAFTPFLAGTLLTLSYSIPLVFGGIASLLASILLFIGYRKH